MATASQTHLLHMVLQMPLRAASAATPARSRVATTRARADVLANPPKRGLAVRRAPALLQRPRHPSDVLQAHLRCARCPSPCRADCTRTSSLFTPDDIPLPDTARTPSGFLFPSPKIHPQSARCIPSPPLLNEITPPDPASTPPPVTSHPSTLWHLIALGHSNPRYPPKIQPRMAR